MLKGPCEVNEESEVMYRYMKKYDLSTDTKIGMDKIKHKNSFYSYDSVIVCS